MVTTRIENFDFQWLHAFDLKRDPLTGHDKPFQVIRE